MCLRLGFDLETTGDVSGVDWSGLPWRRCAVVVGMYACDCTLVSSIGVMPVWCCDLSRAEVDIFELNNVRSFQSYRIKDFVAEAIATLFMLFVLWVGCLQIHQMHNYVYIMWNVCIDSGTLTLSTWT